MLVIHIYNMSGTAAIAAAKNRQSRQSALNNNNTHCNQQQSCSRQGNQNQMQYQQNMTQEPVSQQQRININPMEILKDHELRMQKIESIDCEKIFSEKITPS